ncbi:MULTISPECIES: S9 family peptidase [Brevibacterium]|uniref:Alpha/beta hydrolase n=1 Tax=Brevibacterium casei TaxID=33889 RepID=A0A7T4A171_9MICO|nr:MULTISPECIES: alpha/beta hydrolase [Brevibacterium]QQB15400.1 alpha/beta hydrolase [Brevibacterium casei]
MTDDEHRGGGGVTVDHRRGGGGVDDQRKELAAHWRAMPAQRLLDGGMVHGDVLRLEAATDALTPWDDAAEHLGEAQLARAEAAASAGHDRTAIEAYRAAVADFLFAQMPLPDGPRKTALYLRAREALAAIAAIPGSGLSRVEVPFGAGARDSGSDAARPGSTGTLVGWLLSPANPRASVIVFGGQSGWGATYLRMADALAARGIATLMAEGPGQGESRIVSGINLDVDVAAAFSAFVDALLDRPELAGRPVGIWGNSLGGTFAALTAVADHRITATVVNGGFARPRLLPFHTFRAQAAAMLGTADEAALEANFARLAFDVATDRVAGGILVVHGGADPIVDRDDQTPFLAAAEDATLLEWPGGDHTIYNDSEARTAAVADWLADRLGAGDATAAADHPSAAAASSTSPPPHDP